MAEISVFSRAHRAFRDTPRFHFVRSEPEIADRYRALVSADTGLGDAIGMYMNPDPVQPEVIFVAERGLLAIRSGSVQKIEFSEIESTRSLSAVDDNTDISLVLRSGIVVNLRVAGTDGRFRDVFSFVRFLDRALEDRCEIPQGD
jgi:hypothetical protein